MDHRRGQKSIYHLCLDVLEGDVESQSEVTNVRLLSEESCFNLKESALRGQS